MLKGVLSRTVPLFMAAGVLRLFPVAAAGDSEFGPVQMVHSGGASIDVPGYSVPSYVDWDNDGRKDLIVGQGSGTTDPRVRVYLNTGTADAPQFSGYFCAQSSGSDLTATGSGCMGLFPRICYWDDDSRKDLILGQSDGTIKFYRNAGSDIAPSFDSGTLLQVGAPGSKSNIDVGSRACPDILDWNNDGAKDLIVGALDGKVHLFINVGTDGAPDFLTETFVQEGVPDLLVPGTRSSPVVLDYDSDGRKDLIVGNTYGQLLLYPNTGTDAAPTFSGYTYMESDGVDIDLAASRSRPFACDWTGDGLVDVLIGASDGEVYLYQGIPEPLIIGIVYIGAGLIVRRRTS